MSTMRKSILDSHYKRSLGANMNAAKSNFAPIKWTDYFDSEEYIETSTCKHHIYSKGNQGPIIFCLHGGGYNGLTWALFAKEIFQNIECQIKALDFRGHGNTQTDNDSDLSLETLTKDVVEVANKLCERENSTLVLVGHSMGGAIAVNASYQIEHLVGLCVIDVVEGTALDALSSMQSILRGRPSYFRSIPHAIQWCYKGGQCHNIEAAKVSMPGQIINMKTGKLACDEWDSFNKQEAVNLIPGYSHEVKASEFTIIEDEEDHAEIEYKIIAKPPILRKDFKLPNSVAEADGPKYTWRIDLSKTEPFWQHWFQGLSERFLGTKVPKVLILANIFGLDTKLTVGQMQGKFQLQVLTKTGHAVHEDQPHQVAEILTIYLVKQKCVELKEGFTMPLHPNACC
ncbi:protein phosphatase methylesterase 1 [Cylas formicarius]|uniref:protein phosphatase methylesterase 1 n=1 Tax=Cylas formicarius TaxID=197179 RepID=UPI002958A833|nr:protein phosphatase methylesterase 1 [Cylas formicarius]